MLLSLLTNNFLQTVQMLIPVFLESPCLQTAAAVVLRGGWDREASPLIIPVDLGGAVVWIQEVVVVRVGGVMVAGVEVVVIGVNREGG